MKPQGPQFTNLEEKSQVEELLMGTLSLIKQGWCQEAAMRDSKGQECVASDPDVDSYCLDGALIAASGYVPVDKVFSPTLYAKACHVLLNHIEKEVGWNSVAEFNDFVLTSQEEAVYFLEKAIASMR